MFERYNEKARRTIFFARYEASTFGSPYIESEHMLLGLLREDRTLSMRFITPRTTAEALRKEIEQHQTTVRENIPTSVDLPLSNECKHVLAYAAEESERLGHQHIGPEHLFLGILREEHSLAAELLKQHGIRADEVRKEIAADPPPSGGTHTPSTAPTMGFFQLALRVANLEASIDFYTKLGFTLVRERGSRSAVLTNGSCNLRLDQNLPADQLLCFRSPNITPIVSQLQSAGVEFEQSSETGPDGGTTALLRDPDGNIIFLSSPPPR